MNVTNRHFLFIIPNDSLGGAEQYLMQVACYHLSSNDNVYVLFLSDRNTSMWEDISCDNLKLLYLSNKSLKYFPIFLIGKISCIKKIIFERVYSSHVLTNSCVGLLRRFKLIKSKKHIARESTLIFHRFNGFRLLYYYILYMIGYKSIDLVVCQTKKMRDDLLCNIPHLIKSNNVVFLTNPIDTNKLDKLDFIDGNDYTNYIVSAGRLIKEKGFDILIESFCQLKIKYPELKLLILGEGECFDFLIDMIEKLGLRNEVYLIGFKKNVINYFKSARLCVVSSRVEGFPNVLLQMMYSNTRVVSTLCAGGIEELPGIIKAQINSVDALYEAMELGINISDSQSNKNRIIFDKYLSDKSINAFMNRVDSLLN